MTLPASPPLSITQILTELGRLAAGQSLTGAADERDLSGVASGAISFSDYLGKSAVTPGNQTFTGSGTFTVPEYNTLTVVCYGSGGGGGGSLQTDGPPEYNISAAGGDGGNGGFARFSYGATPPTGNGGFGGKGEPLPTGDGADGANGGGSGGTVVVGGGAAGGNGGTFYLRGKGGEGGNGGRVTISYTAGSGPTPGTNITVTVQNGGAGGIGDGGGNGSVATGGTKGHVTVSWS